MKLQTGRFVAKGCCEFPDVSGTPKLALPPEFGSCAQNHNETRVARNSFIYVVWGKFQGRVVKIFVSALLTPTARQPIITIMLLPIRPATTVSAVLVSIRDRDAAQTRIGNGPNQTIVEKDTPDAHTISASCTQVCDTSPRADMVYPEEQKSGGLDSSCNHNWEIPDVSDASRGLGLLVFFAKGSPSPARLAFQNVLGIFALLAVVQCSWL